MLFLYFQIFRDDPVLPVSQNMSNFLFAGPERNAYSDLSFWGDADRVALAVAADEDVGKFIQLTLVFDT